LNTAAGESGAPGFRLSITAFLLSFGASWNAGNVGPIVSPLADEFSVSLGAVGLLSGTLFFAGVALATFLGAELGRRVPLGIGLRMSCGLGATGNAMCALSPVFAGLAAGRLIAGLALGAAFLFGGAFARAVGGARLIGVFGVGVTLGVAIALALGACSRTWAPSGGSRSRSPSSSRSRPFRSCRPPCRA
jgi:predicted MFS family arabinose efflux permease